MTPIEKNINVVDEQGNQYEATYPKRAKGLVKNGRARFINENTICLLCPPDQKVEDNQMTENNKLTAKEVFDQICLLQKQMTESTNSLHRLADSVEAIYAEEGEDRKEQISEVCSVFAMREDNYATMLKMYQKIYDSIVNEDAKKIGLIQVVLSGLSDKITKSDLPPNEKSAMIREVSDKVEALAEKWLTPTDK